MAFSSPQQLRPLNVGSVVSAGFSLWRTHFKTYVGLSGKAILWYFVPIYGWARSLMIMGQIGRLGFQEVIHQPETIPVSLRKVKPRLWSFLGIAMLVGIIQFAVNYGISLIGGGVLFVVATLGGEGGAPSLLSNLLLIVGQLIIVTLQMWVQARLWLYDMIIAVETNTEATASISRSWQLTQGLSVRILLVLLVTYLVMLPLFVLALVPFLFTLPFLINISPVEGPSSTVILAVLMAALAFLVLIIVAAIITIPFWQSIKAVLYYDLRSRREGLDIQLRDRPNTP